MTSLPTGAGRWLVVLALAGVILVACGKQGPPVAPELRLPRSASALHAHIDEEAVVVGWTIPRTRADGSALRDLSSVRLYRREEDDGAPAKAAMLSAGRIVGYDEIAVVRLDSPAPAIVRGDAMEWVDRRGLAPGRRYVYVVTATDAQGRISAPSERLAVPYLAAPRPPKGKVIDLMDALRQSLAKKNEQLHQPAAYKKSSELLKQALTRSPEFIEFAFPVAMAAPMMKKKGRIQIGADADLAIFDPKRFQQRQHREECDGPAVQAAARHE